MNFTPYNFDRKGRKPELKRLYIGNGGKMRYANSSKIQMRKENIHKIDPCYLYYEKRTATYDYISWDASRRSEKRSIAYMIFRDGDEVFELPLLEFTDDWQDEIFLNEYKHWIASKQPIVDYLQFKHVL